MSLCTLSVALCCITLMLTLGVNRPRRGSRILVRGPSGVVTQRGGALSPKCTRNRGFSLKWPENCMNLKKSWGARGRPPRPPGSATGTLSPGLRFLEE